jgi:hypothetical protein
VIRWWRTSWQQSNRNLEGGYQVPLTHEDARKWATDQLGRRATALSGLLFDGGKWLVVGASLVGDRVDRLIVRQVPDSQRLQVIGVGKMWEAAVQDAGLKLSGTTAGAAYPSIGGRMAVPVTKGLRLPVRLDGCGLGRQGMVGLLRSMACAVLGQGEGGVYGRPQSGADG